MRMSRRESKKFGTGFRFTTLVLVVLVVAVGRKVWPMVGNFVLPMHCSSLEERADMARDFCEQHGMRSDCCVFVDFGMPSKEKKFMVYDLREKRIISSGLVAHGMGHQARRSGPLSPTAPGATAPLWADTR